MAASPTANSKKGGAGAPARIGEDFQAEVVSTLDYIATASEHSRSLPSMTTRGSSSGSAVYWHNASASGEDSTDAEGEVSAYLSRAWEIIDRLKAEKLSEYFQSERESLLDGSEDKDAEAAVETGTDSAGVEGVEGAEAIQPAKKAKKEVEVLDGTFVTINKEAEEILLYNFAVKYVLRCTY